MVTGASGFIGRHAVARLLERGHEVVAVSRDETKARQQPWFGAVRFIACDVHQPLAAPAAFFGRPDAVMHLAWPGLPNYDRPFHVESVLPADSRFLESLVQDGVAHLLVTGTCFEYGMKEGIAMESDVPAPANSYAIAKDELRRFLEQLQQQRAFTLQWARLFYLYGDGQNPASLIAQLDRAIQAKQPEFNMSGGEQLRDYLPVHTAASHLVALLEEPTCHGVINICSGQPISVRTLCERHVAARGARLRLNFGFYPYPAHEPMAFWGDRQRLNSLLRADAVT